MPHSSNGTPTIGPSVTASPPPSSWGSGSSRDSNEESVLTSFDEDGPAVQQMAQGHTNDVAIVHSEGWPLLAELMATTRDFEAFSRFTTLQVKNLLYYQVELAELEGLLTETEREDMNPTLDATDSEFKPSQIHRVPGSMMDEEHPNPQWDLVVKIREVLRKYNKALLQYAEISAIPEPSEFNMRELVTWMNDARCGKGSVQGGGAEVWGPYKPRNSKVSCNRILSLPLSFFSRQPKPPFLTNLAAPRARDPTDRLNRWVAEQFVPLLWDICHFRSRKQRDDLESQVQPRQVNDEKKKTKKEEQESESTDPRIGDKYLQKVSEHRVQAISVGICTVIACVLPILSVFLLTRVHDLYHRLTMITSFALLFASLLLSLTEANKIHIFTATSAFLAVLVVFIPVDGGY